MSWLRAIPFLFTLLALVLQPASASAFGNAHPEARVSAFELVATTVVGASAETSPGLHEGIAEAYDENASGYRFAARGALPRSGPIARSLGAMSRSEHLARKLKLNINSPTTRQVLNSLDDTVSTFVGQFRKGSIPRELPGEVFDVFDMTVEQALQHSSKVRKLLIDGRVVK